MHKKREEQIREDAEKRIGQQRRGRGREEKIREAKRTGREEQI